MNKTLIIDGNNCIHRTFWTAKNIAGGDNDKLDSFHIYFTLNAIKSYVSKFSPDKVFICWDEKINYQVNDRKISFTDYKGTRSTDSTPHRNNNTIKEFLNLLGITSMYPSSLEADDCIAFLCNELPGSKVIVSADMDFYQLVSKTTSVYSPIKKIHITESNFTKEAGYNINKFLTVKCIQGDKSDNVPGIPKFGKVKLNKFLEGEIKLTEDQIQIYDRNYELFRLDRFKDQSCIDEYTYYVLQLKESENLKSDYQDFIALCVNHKINNILSKKEDWYQLFYFKNKLIDLFR